MNEAERKSFVVSFPDGICRLARADTLDGAISEVGQACIATGRISASILEHSTYKVLGDVYVTGGKLITYKERK